QRRRRLADAAALGVLAAAEEPALGPLAQLHRRVALRAGLGDLHLRRLPLRRGLRQVELLAQLVGHRLFGAALPVGGAARGPARAAPCAPPSARRTCRTSRRCPAAGSACPRRPRPWRSCTSGSRCRPKTARAAPRAAPSACRTSRRCTPSPAP